VQGAAGAGAGDAGVSGAEDGYLAGDYHAGDSGKNDSAEELRQIAEFIARLGLDVPWHISRFFPQYQLSEALPTAEEELGRAYDIGKAAGLRYVYVGNLPGNRAESTWCYSCGALLIERIGYRVKSNRILDYRCPQCRAEISGFELSSSSTGNDITNGKAQ
jgi:pyruvate formate lyase activating enzyme